MDRHDLPPVPKDDWEQHVDETGAREAQGFVDTLKASDQVETEATGWLASLRQRAEEETRAAQAPPPAAPGSGGEPDRAAFFARMRPIAEQSSARTGIPTEVYLAVAANESNFGNAPGNSLFGVKGRGVASPTWEAGPGGERVAQSAEFQGYGSPEESFADFDRLVTSGRYAPAYQRFRETGDADAYLADLQRAGYATDPNWARSIRGIADTTVRQYADAPPPATEGERPPSEFEPRTDRPHRADANAIPDQFASGLSDADAAAACGPALAVWFAQTQGRNPGSLGEAVALARQYGWNPAGGMNGLRNQARLLDAMGVDARVEDKVDEQKLAADANSGNPVGISSGFHYFGADAYDPATRKFHVGVSGTVVRGGSEWMTLDEMDRISRERSGTGLNGAIYVNSPSSAAPSAAVWDQDPERAATGWIDSLKALGRQAGDAAVGVVDGAASAARGWADRAFGNGAPDPMDDPAIRAINDRADRNASPLLNVGRAVVGELAAAPGRIEPMVEQTADDMDAFRAEMGRQGEKYARGEQLTPEEIAHGLDLATPFALSMTGEPLKAVGGAVRAARGVAASEGGLGQPGMSLQVVRSSDPDLAKIQAMYDDKPVASSVPLADRLETARRSFVRAWTDRGVDLAEFQKKAAQALGRPLQADEMAYELSRMNADMAAKVKVDEGLRPILQAAGDDYGYVRDYLTARGNLDVAAALGQRAERAVLTTPLTPTLAEQAARTGESRVRMLERLRDRARASGDTALADNYEVRIGETRQQIQRAERRALRQVTAADQARADRAQETGAAVEANRRFSSGVDAEASQRAIDAMERELGPDRFARVQQLADRVADFNKQLLQEKLDAGLITKDQFAQWTTDYPHYSPVKITDYLKDAVNGNAAAGSGKSLSVRSNGIRVLSDEGTGRLREDPIASTLRNAYETEALVKRNNAFNAFAKLRAADPALQAQIREVPAGYTATRSEQAVTGFIDGERKTFVMPTDMAAVVKQEGVAPVPVLGPLMQLFKMAVTSRNPVFLAGNAVNDAVSYVLRTSAREGGPQHALPIIADLAKAYVDAFGGLLSGEFRGDTARFLKEGGGQFGFFNRSEAGAREGVEALRRANVLAVNGLDDLKRIAGDVLALKPVEGLGERIELAPRVAAFRRAERAGASPPEAAVAGRSVTIDFAQGGRVAKILNGYIPFFNVGIQAAATPVRAVAENPRGAALTALGLLVAPTVAAEAWNNADPQRAKDYADVPNYLKDQGIVIMLPTEAPVDERGERRPQFVHIRMRDYAPFTNLIKEVANRVVGGDPRGWGGILWGSVTQAAPVNGIESLVPPGVSTGVQLAADRDLYRGRDIATRTGDEDAAALSKGVAAAINAAAAATGRYPNVRPSQVDFAARSLGGGVAGSVLAASDAVSGSPRRSGTPQDTPVAGGFVSRLVRGDVGQEAQDARDQRLSGESMRALYDAGLKPDVSSVKGEIDGARLTRGEQAAYQRLANEHVETAILRVSTKARWDTADQATKEQMLREAVAAAHEKAKDQMIKEIGRAEVRARARDERDRKAG